MTKKPLKPGKSAKVLKKLQKKKASGEKLNRKDREAKRAAAKIKKRVVTDERGVTGGFPLRVLNTKLKESNRKELLVDFFYHDGDVPDLGVEVEAILRKTPTDGVYSLVISFLAEDAHMILRGAFNIETSKQIALSTNAPYSMSLVLLPCIVDGERVLRGEFREVFEWGGTRTGLATLYLP